LLLVIGHGDGCGGEWGAESKVGQAAYGTATPAKSLIGWKNLIANDI
jgi:hypothetical protein